MLLKDFLRLANKTQGVVVQDDKDYKHITDYALRHQDKFEIVDFHAYNNIIFVLVKQL